MFTVAENQGSHVMTTAWYQISDILERQQWRWDSARREKWWKEKGKKKVSLGLETFCGLSTLSKAICGVASPHDG